MKKLEESTGAVTGRGPDHPVRPDHGLRPAVEDFIDAYPFLRSDDVYVSFLARYAGAYAESEDGNQIIDVFGFGGPSTDILEMEGPVVDDEGFLIFAQCLYSDVSDGALVDSYEYDFAFSAREEKPRGVYCSGSTLRTHGQGFELYAENFHQWLLRIIEVNGRLGRPEVP
ncbi:hypothetical protein [Streptomyces sp. DH37]|uniref:hypothetical protein n=1 Tax=Streptomyces sp. DH37 TaxID=3040122 RepID=UPI0024419B3D|nr:hypothetical protein [Streptomyces sp. DH37]MDG9700678.1 hypothetical protein [Streptomyces sp. DH37]